METKICNGPTCDNTEHPLTEFNKDRSREDGLSPYCRKCQSYYHKQRYRTPEGHKVKLEYQKKYEKSPAGKQTRKRSYEKQLKKYPNRRKARAAVNNAIMYGKLDRASCHQCAYPGCSKSAQEYHHHSYKPEHWLDVIPYCIRHHKKIEGVLVE